MERDKIVEVERNEKKEQVKAIDGSKGYKRLHQRDRRGERDAVKESDGNSKKLKHLTPLSTKCVPMISEETNLFYEALYLKLEDPIPDTQERQPKKKVALLLSYCGTGYQGMQINPGVPTIELDLFKALCAAGAISSMNAMDPQKSSYMRCARTDKGVHAGGQLVSLKMMTPPFIIDTINSFLPKQIRVWGFARVNKAFGAKDLCDSRIYEYLMPTYCLAEADPSEYPKSKIAEGKVLKVRIPRDENFIFNEDELNLKREYRASPSKLAHFNEILQKFKGTQNFHNFTVGKDFKERSAKRFILSVTLNPTFIRNGCEFVSIKIHGQSFMLHQIRKMIGLALLVIRTDTPVTLMDEAFKAERINIPKAPPIGLLLERPVFDRYNQDNGKSEAERDLIDFSQYQEKIDAFKSEFIYNEMIQNEEVTHDFMTWLYGADCGSDNWSWYLRSDGLIHSDEKPEGLFDKINTE